MRILLLIDNSALLAFRGRFRLPPVVLDRLADPRTVNDGLGMVLSRSVAMMHTVNEPSDSRTNMRPPPPNLWIQGQVESDWGPGPLEREWLTVRLDITPSGGRLPVQAMVATVAAIGARLGGASVDDVYAEMPLRGRAQTWRRLSQSSSWFHFGSLQRPTHYHVAVGVPRGVPENWADQLSEAIAQHSGLYGPVLTLIEQMPDTQYRTTVAQWPHPAPGMRPAELPDVEASSTRIAFDIRAVEESSDVIGWTLEFFAEMVRHALDPEWVTVRVVRSG